VMGKPLADYVCHRINGFLNGGFHIREFTGMVDPETEMLVQPLELTFRTSPRNFE
jgi:hypothetical protein